MALIRKLRFKFVPLKPAPGMLKVEDNFNFENKDVIRVY